MGIRLLKTMPIINHRHFKSQAFILKKIISETLRRPSEKVLNIIGVDL